MHGPALVAPLMSDNDGNRRGHLFGSNVKARRVFGRSRSRFQRTRILLNSNVAVIRHLVPGANRNAVDRLDDPEETEASPIRLVTKTVTNQLDRRPDYA